MSGKALDKEMRENKAISK